MTRPNPLLDPDSPGGVRNVVFFYQHISSLANPATTLGSPSIVVTTPGADNPATIKEIHAIGAKAFLYFQFYWAPGDRTYEGVNLADHPDWRFCLSDNTPTIGRVLELSRGRAENWYFLDGNEVAVRAEYERMFEKLKAEGWDGIMFDRGMAATQNAFNAAGTAIWYRKSTCTANPYQRGATLADAYVNVLRLAKQTGFQVMVNNGISPFDPTRPMRPDPRTKACQVGNWPACRVLSDEWNDVDLVLNETGSAPRDQDWNETFVGNKRSEQNASHGRRTVVMITTATLGNSNANQTKTNIYFQWARVRLFNLAVSVNSGNDKCPGAAVANPCDRYGVYPSLANLRFGRPISSAPGSRRCLSGSVIRCVWSRSYANGVDLVNVTPRTQTGVKVKVTSAACRYVVDTFTGRPLGGNRCVHSVALTLGPWTGHPLAFSTRRDT